MDEQAPDGLFQQRGVQRLRRFAQEGPVPMMRINRLSLEEDSLDRRERKRPGDDALLRPCDFRRASRLN